MDKSVKVQEGKGLSQLGLWLWSKDLAGRARTLMVEPGPGHRQGSYRCTMGSNNLHLQIKVGLGYGKGSLDSSITEYCPSGISQPPGCGRLPCALWTSASAAIATSHSSAVGGGWVNKCDKKHFGDSKKDDISFRYWIWLLVNVSLRTINILKQPPPLIKLARMWGKAVSNAACGKVSGDRGLVRGIKS